MMQRFKSTANFSSTCTHFNFNKDKDDLRFSSVEKHNQELHTSILINTSTYDVGQRAGLGTFSRCGTSCSG